VDDGLAHVDPRPGPDWGELFAAERERLLAALDDPAVAVEHIGSTAIPGMPGKPVLDVAVGLPPGASLTPRARASLAELGFSRLRRRRGRAYLVRSDPPACVLHVLDRDGTWWRRQLLLRDAMRADPALAAAYAEVKRQAAQAGPGAARRLRARWLERVVAELRAREATTGGVQAGSRTLRRRR
jgi:GrpB-like predicted nucleotidyltransferase (UPF0157 family)